MELKLTFHTDPGHGWIAVKRTQLAAWSLLDRVSAYSYQSKSGKTVYLEEDGDAALLFKHAETVGVKITCETKYKERSPVRSYPPFQK